MTRVSIAKLSSGLLSGALLLPLALQSGVARAAGPVLPLSIDTASGHHVFDVEWEKTNDERERGLMNRRTMPPNHGMLFDFRPHDEPVMFWMKNTFLPLDMIFISRDGRVVSIKHDAQPMDETVIPSGAPTTAVLEVNAGVTETIGLKVGDRVKHAMFDEATRR